MADHRRPASLQQNGRCLQSFRERFGLRRGNLGKGVGWAVLLGAAFGFVQIFLSGNSAEVQEAIRTGRALYLLPLGFVLMMLLAGFTEEFFFRLPDYEDSVTLFEHIFSHC